MNGKKAKQLRRQAEKLSIGMPSVAYRKYNPAPPSLVRNPKSTGLNDKFLRVGDWRPIVMLHACTRNIYKLLKNSL